MSWRRRRYYCAAAAAAGYGAVTAYRVWATTTTPQAGSTITVYAQRIDDSGNDVPESGVSTAWGITNGTPSSATSVTDANGRTSITVDVSTVSTTAHLITALDQNGHTGSVTVTVVAGPLSYAQSTVIGSPAAILNDGVSTSTVTVQLRDVYGNARTSSGGTVLLSTTHGTLGAVTNHLDGSYTAVLTSSLVVETAVISATLDGVALTATASVSFSASNEPGAYIPCFWAKGIKETHDLGGVLASFIGGKFYDSAYDPDYGIQYVSTVTDAAAPFGTATEHHWIANSVPDDVEGARGILQFGQFQPCPQMGHMYARIIFKLSPNFVGHPGGSKILYLGNIIYLVIVNQGGGAEPFLYSAHVSSAMDIGCSDNIRITTGPITVNTYHKLELLCQASSAQGVHDGHVTAWFNGALVQSELSHINWHDSRGPKFSGFEWDAYWGGSGGHQKREAGWALGTYDWIRFGEIYISGTAA